MRILVTGCNGYIGSHVVKSLKESGHSISGWDINVYGPYNDVSKYLDNFESVDVRTLDNTQSFDAVIHLAGLVSVEESVRLPYEYYYANIIGTNNILDYIETDHILFASTASAWAMDSPYACSKVAAEDIIRQKSKSYTIFRFFNVSGTNGEFGQLGIATHLIRIVAEAAAGTRSKLQVYGNDYDTRDGTCIRDYVHVEDLSDAVVYSITNGARNSKYECIGSDKGFTVLEVINTMEKVTGKKINFDFSKRRSGDSSISVVDELSTMISVKRNLEQMCLDQYNFEIKKLGKI
jgi:UDP-glucose 4-epimerase